MKITRVSAAAAAVMETAKTKTKDIVTIVSGENFPASAISDTHEVPTGRERLLHAIKSGKEAYHQTNKGKRIPKKPTKKEMRKALNRMLRTKAA